MLLFIPLILAIFCPMTYFLIQDAIWPDLPLTLGPGYVIVKRLAAPPPPRWKPAVVETCTNVFSPDYLFANGLPADKPTSNWDMMRSFGQDFLARYPNLGIYITLLVFTIFIFTGTTAMRMYFNGSKNLKATGYDITMYSLMFGTEPEPLATNSTARTETDEHMWSPLIHAKCRAGMWRYVASMRLSALKTQRQECDDHMQKHAAAIAERNNNFQRSEDQVAHLKHTNSELARVVDSQSSDICENRTLIDELNSRLENQSSKSQHNLAKEKESHEKVVTAYEKKIAEMVIDHRSELYKSKADLKSKHDKKIHGYETKVETLEKLDKDAQASKAELESSLNTKSDQLREKDVEINRLSKEVKVAKANQSHLEAVSLSAQKQLAASQDRVESLGAELNIKNADIEKLNEDLKLAQSNKVDSCEREELAASNNQKVQQLLADAEDRKKESDHMCRTIDTIKSEQAEIEKRAVTAESELALREQKIEAISAILKEKNQDIADLKADYEQREMRLEETQAETRAEQKMLQNKVKAGTQKLITLEAEFKSFQCGTASLNAKLEQATKDKDSAVKKVELIEAELEKKTQYAAQVTENANAEKASLQKQLSERNIEIYELEKNKNEQLKVSSDSLASNAEKTVDQVKHEAQVDAEKLAWKKQNTELKAQVNKLQQEVKSFRNHARASDASDAPDQKQTEMVIGTLTAERDSLRMQLSVRNFDNYQLENKIRALESQLAGASSAAQADEDKVRTDTESTDTSNAVTATCGVADDYQIEEKHLVLEASQSKKHDLGSSRWAKESPKTPIPQVYQPATPPVPPATTRSPASDSAPNSAATSASSPAPLSTSLLQSRFATPTPTSIPNNTDLGSGEYRSFSNRTTSATKKGDLISSKWASEPPSSSSSTNGRGFNSKKSKKGGLGISKGAR